MSITVKALSAGYYGTRRRPGDIFEIESEECRGKWMGEVGDGTIPKPRSKPFTSIVKGTESGGNVFSPQPGGTPKDEPKDAENKTPQTVKKKTRNKKR
jgi:hypothetical protein